MGLVIALLIPDSTPQQPLIVYAAASLRRPLEALTPDFEQRVGCRVEYRFGGSEAMLNQLRLTLDHQPADLYIPADESYFSGATDLVGTQLTLAQMQAVLLVEAASPISSWPDLERPGVRLALAQPDIAAIGRLTRQTFQQRGTWTDVERRLHVTPENVVQSATAVELRTVDAAIVWDAVAAGFRNCRTVHCLELEAITARVQVGLIRHARHPEAAIRFARYLQEDPAGTLQNMGFRRVRE